MPHFYLASWLSLEAGSTHFSSLPLIPFLNQFTVVTPHLSHSQNPHSSSLSLSTVAQGSFSNPSCLRNNPPSPSIVGIELRFLSGILARSHRTYQYLLISYTPTVSKYAWLSCLHQPYCLTDTTRCRRPSVFKGSTLVNSTYPRPASHWSFWG